MYFCRVYNISRMEGTVTNTQIQDSNNSMLHTKMEDLKMVLTKETVQHIKKATY
jgi:hypothetical protein